LPFPLFGSVQLCACLCIEAFHERAGASAADDSDGLSGQFDAHVVLILRVNDVAQTPTICLPRGFAGMTIKSDQLDASICDTAVQKDDQVIVRSWNDLAASEDVRSALDTKVATQTELLAAGYNSNAAKLPLYLRRGGNGWRTLIPRETQMYLQIYRAVDSLAPVKPRTAPLATPKAE